MVRPETIVEWLVAPVLENVLLIAEYETPAVVEYLHVAFSFVVKEIVVDDVPAARVPEGLPLDRTGGVVSVAGTTKLHGLENEPRQPPEAARAATRQ